jgi:mono/diheme cytochrome c family protein
MNALLRFASICLLALALFACDRAPPTPKTRLGEGVNVSYAEIQRGKYLVQAGDCKACHTVEGGAEFAGGRAVPTPFGVIYSTNITPDSISGIGNWSENDLYNAMHFGIRRNGDYLYPAFPYPWYTKVNRDDVYAIKAYLDTLEPVRQENKPTELAWPLNSRSLMAGWNMLFFTEGVYRDDPGKSAQWNRGAYLIEGLTHCGACHTEINIAGGSKKSKALQGGVAESWYAPSLAGNLRDGLGGWSEDEIVEYLATGSNAKSSAAGPMAEVIAESTQHLSVDDLRAIAVYLKDMPSPKKTERQAIDLATLSVGAGLYADNCTGCHMSNGEGQKNVFPPLKGSSAVQAQEPMTVLQVVLTGAAMPATHAKPTALAMPEFSSKLNDDEIAEVVNFIRNAWGNRASTVSAKDVAKLREAMM